jgi:L-ascorbate metabolism protein UlaG (beta-lactamase superfamily)
MARLRRFGGTAFSVLAAAALVGCVEVQKRNLGSGERTTASIALSATVTLTTWEAERTTWKPSACRIDGPGSVVYIDPIDVEGDGPETADLVLITHSHADHLSPRDIAKILGPKTLIVCPVGVKPGIEGAATIEMRPGELREFGNLRIEALPAYNFVHPRFLGFLGYVVEIGGARIYHAGDTGPIAEAAALKGIDAALVPIATDFLAMSPEAAAGLVNSIAPRIAVPIHYELGKGKAERFRAAVRDGTEAVITDAVMTEGRAR